MAEGKGINIGLSIVITLSMALITGAGTYFSATYSMQNEINLVKAAAEVKDKRIAKLEAEFETLRDLPAKMEALQKTQDDTQTMVRVIRDGLIANGTLKPSNG